MVLQQVLKLFVILYFTALIMVKIGDKKISADDFYKVLINNIQLDIDEDTLRKISDRTGGKYYRADNAERFQKIYAEIDKLERTEAEVKKFVQHTELFVWLIALGLVLLTAEIALGQTVLRRLP